MEDPLKLRVEAHTLYVTQMLARLGFGPDALDAHLQDDALLSRCRTCDATEKCARWLGNGANSRPREVPDFCPNREHFASLARDL